MMQKGEKDSPTPANQHLANCRKRAYGWLRDAARMSNFLAAELILERLKELEK